MLSKEVGTFRKGELTIRLDRLALSSTSEVIPGHLVEMLTVEQSQVESGNTHCVSRM